MLKGIKYKGKATILANTYMMRRLNLCFIIAHYIIIEKDKKSRVLGDGENPDEFISGFFAFYDAESCFFHHEMAGKDA